MTTDKACHYCGRDHPTEIVCDEMLAAHNGAIAFLKSSASDAKICAVATESSEAPSVAGPIFDLHDELQESSAAQAATQYIQIGAPTSQDNPSVKVHSVRTSDAILPPTPRTDQLRSINCCNAEVWAQALEQTERELAAANARADKWKKDWNVEAEQREHDLEELSRALVANSTEYLRGRDAEIAARAVADSSWKERYEAERRAREEAEGALRSARGRCFELDRAIHVERCLAEASEARLATVRQALIDIRDNTHGGYAYDVAIRALSAKEG